MVYATCKTKHRRKTTTKKKQSHRARTRYRLQRHLRESSIKCLMYAPLICMHTETNSKRAHQIHFDTDSRFIRIDNCATTSISPYIEDFLDPPTVDRNKRIKGISGTIGGAMIGTIKWQIEDDDGVVHDIILPNSIYLQNATSRLLSPQHWAQTAKDNKPERDGTWCATYSDKVILYWNQRKCTRTIQLDKNGSNVATIRSAPGYNKYETFCSETHQPDDDSVLCYDAKLVSDAESDDETTTDNDNNNDFAIRTAPITSNYSMNDNRQSNTTSMDIHNISNDDRLVVIQEDEEERQPSLHSAEFLQWHHRLGHISPKKIRMMAQAKILPSYLQHCHVPICSSCLYGKMTRRPWRSKSNNNHNETENLKLRPGECVSIDQLESTTPGLLAQLRGIPTKLCYKVATVFVDHATRYSYVHLQKSTSAEETIQAKQAFETIAKNNGIRIMHYHADNGIFAHNKFRTAVQQSAQTLSFCGVNAHFQNGVAERRIRELQEHSRTMLIHAKKRWPTAITSHLWPYALRQANDVLNESPSLVTRKIPVNDFAGTHITTNPKHWHAFGCPVYILDNDLQTGKKIDKWSNRSKIGINLGRSPLHANTVYLVLSLTKGLVSPQFHIKMDDKFETLRTVYGGSPPLSQWQEKCHFLAPQEVPTSSTPKNSTRKRKITIVAPTVQAPSVHTAPSMQASSGVQAPSVQIQEQQTSTNPVAPDVVTTRNGSLEAPEGAPVHDNDKPLLIQRISTNTNVKINNVYVTDKDQNTLACTSTSTNSTTTTKSLMTTNTRNNVLSSTDKIFSSIIDEYDERELMAYAARKDPDTMYLHETMQQPDKNEFLQAMIKEVNGQLANGNFQLVHIHDVPKGSSILPAVWAMRRKRRIDTGEVYKWKARLNIDGSKQTKGINYWGTYSPVALWAIIRLLLILVLTKGWKTRQIDYVQAYTQADAETDLLYMKTPKGFTITNGDPNDYVLQIKKNIYGQKQAGRVWNKHLVQKLAQAGFKQSTVDDCVFYWNKCIYVLYTDDSILAGPNDKLLDKAIERIQSVGLEITVEEKVNEFLGVKITKLPSGQYQLTQPHLIKQILEDLRLLNSNVATKKTPAAPKQILRKFEEMDAFDQNFDYRSVIGKLNYLEKSTRPDISYAVHQCARFVSNPREPHGKAVKYLGRYLKATEDKGLIFTPDTNKSLECFVDADFAGNWNKIEATNDRDTARSRTGFVITYAGCPLVWASKLQTPIALSSTEAEYIAISTAMREVIPIMAILEELQLQEFVLPSTTPMIHCNVFEDNSGAIEIAKLKKYRPRTKHINNQYHHFRSYVDSNQVSLHYINTKSQMADMLTKSLSQSDFTKHRTKLMGW